MSILELKKDHCLIEAGILTFLACACACVYNSYFKSQMASEGHLTILSSKNMNELTIKIQS